MFFSIINVKITKVSNSSCNERCEECNKNTNNYLRLDSNFLFFTFALLFLKNGNSCTKLVIVFLYRFTTFFHSFLDAIKSGVRERIAQENKITRASKQSIVAQIQAIKGKESKLLDTFLDGKCSEALYNTKTAEFKEEIKKLEARLEESPEADKEATEALNHIIDIAGHAVEIMNSSINAKKREFLKTILSNGGLKGTSACFYLKKPFEKLLFSKGCKLWVESTRLYRAENPIEFERLGKVAEIFMRDWFAES